MRISKDDLYMTRIDETGNEKIINAYPCFICKKMIINSGVKEFMATRQDGTIKKYEISDWAQHWQENDLIDGENYK